MEDSNLNLNKCRWRSTQLDKLILVFYTLLFYCQGSNPLELENNATPNISQNSNLLLDHTSLVEMLNLKGKWQTINNQDWWSGGRTKVSEVSLFGEGGLGCAYVWGLALDTPQSATYLW